MEKHFNMKANNISRRKLINIGGATLGAAAVGSLGTSSFRIPAQAQSTPNIPEVTVSMGTVGYTNQAWTMLANELGYLSDVGITWQTDLPRVLLDQQVIPLLQRGELDFNSLYMGIVAQSLGTFNDIVPILTYSYWQGNVILTSPNSEFKTVDDFLGEGLSWEEAASKAMEQLRGKKLTTQPISSQIPWIDLAFSFANMQRQESELVIVEDPRAVQLALSNQVEFSAPGGAVQIYQLQFQNQFRPVMSTKQMIANTPAEEFEKVSAGLHYDSIVCTRDYLENNRDTVLRYTSAMFRTIESMFGSNQDEVLALYSPFISSITGADIDVSSIKFIFDELDPFFKWEMQEQLYYDKEYPLQYENLYGLHLENFIANETIPDEDYDLDAIFTSKGIYDELKQYKEESELLITQGNAEDLSDERTVLFDAGVSHFENMNYLDSKRFLESALS